MFRKTATSRNIYQTGMKIKRNENQRYMRLEMRNDDAYIGSANQARSYSIEDCTPWT